MSEPRQRSRRRPEPQSAAAPSPFTPIADYAFLSDCHTGALVAPDGAIDWLCVPRFDAPSVFGIAARPRGRLFRLGPFGINHPVVARVRPRHQHARHDLAHAERLGRRARRADDGPAARRGHDHPAHAAAGRRRRRPPARPHGRVHRAAASRSSWSASRCSTTGASRRSGRWSATTATPPTRRGAGQTIRLQTDMALGHRGQPRARAARPARRASELFCSLSWAEELACPDGRRRRRRRGSTPRRASGATGSTGRASPTTAGASRSSARRWRSRASPTCRPARPSPRSPPRCRRRRAASATGTTATRGCATRRSRCRRCTGSNLDWEADEFMQFVADLEPNADGSLQIMYGIDGRRDLTETTRDDLSGYAGARPVRIGNGAFDQRQNDVYGAALDSILLHTRRSQRLPRRLWPIVQAQAEGAIARLARARPGHLGGARRAAALRLVEAHVLGRDGPRGQAGRHPRRPRARERLGARPRRRSRPTSSSTASTPAACCASTTRPTRSTPRRCWRRSSASCPATTSGCGRACWRSPTS